MFVFIQITKLSMICFYVQSFNFQRRTFFRINNKVNMKDSITDSLNKQAR